jgi:hypothetical protein
MIPSSPSIHGPLFLQWANIQYYAKTGDTFADLVQRFREAVDPLRDTCSRYLILPVPLLVNVWRC